ncbi:hypothetical protein Ancab_010788 [Ancistrocladus abbreviatus]
MRDCLRKWQKDELGDGTSRVAEVKCGIAEIDSEEEARGLSVSEVSKRKALFTEGGRQANTFNLSTPPNIYVDVVTVEKPFGCDFYFFVEFTRGLKQYLTDEQIFRLMKSVLL